MASDDAAAGRVPGLEIVDHAADAPADAPFLHRVVGAVLRHLQRGDWQVALLLADDDEIAELHGRYLGDARSTDVISFGEPDDDAVDVVVNVALARREAERRGSDARTELALYVVHGLLHCGGYDDHDEAERRAMRAAENEVLRTLDLRHAPVDE